MTDQTPTPSEPQDVRGIDPVTREKVSARIWREVFQPPRGVMWTSKGDVPAEVRERVRAAAERLYRDGLIAAVSAAAPDERALAWDEAERRWPSNVLHQGNHLRQEAFVAGWAAALAARPAPVVSGAPIKVEWGVIVDDVGSTAVYDVLDQAMASATYADGTCPVVRIETWPHLPGTGYYATFNRTVADAPAAEPDDPDDWHLTHVHAPAADDEGGQA